MSIRRPRRRPARRLRVESLEARLAPATLTGGGIGSTVAIDLDNANEALTFASLGAGTYAVTSNFAINSGGLVAPTSFAGGVLHMNGANAIQFTDSQNGTSVTFTDSGVNHYSEFIQVSLDNPNSAVGFTGTSTFDQDFTAAAATNITSAPGSTLVATVGNVTLSAGGTVLLDGAVTGGNGLFSFFQFTSGPGGGIQAANPANDFQAVVQLNAGAGGVTLTDVNDLVLGASTLNFGSLGQTGRIAAGGNITQTGALTATATAPVTLAVASTGGSISLNNAGNSISSNVALALSATGTNTATVVNAASLTLGDVTLGTGLLGLTVSGNLTQRAGTTIQTDGRVGVTVATNNRDVLLSNAGNRIGGLVVVGEAAAGFLRDFALRNADDDAAPPADGTFSPFSTANDVRNLTLFFDNNGIDLPGYAITGNLSVTAGGDVTQFAALTVPGDTTITILGDFAITLNGPGNTFTGFVALNAPQSTQPVAVVDGGALDLGACNLGRGTFSATAATGNITQSGAFAQEKGAGAATFTVTAGGTITLNNAGNRFPGSVVLAGAGLNTVNVRNADFQAAFGQFTFPATITDLTVRLDNASIVLPTLTLTNLTVNAQGIVQAPGSALTVSGLANFAGNAFAIDLSNSGNDFGNLNLTNTGRNDVTVVDSNALAFSGNSTVGTGRLRVTVGGSITAVGAGRITQQNNAGPVGEVTLTSTTGGVTLPNNNAFRGPLSVTVSGANTVNVFNNNVPLALGAVTTGTGAFTANAGTQGITQDPNSVLSLGGSSSFTSGNTITLTNRTNTFGGPVALNAANASVRATGAVVLADSNVVGTLSVKTGGSATDSITQTGVVTGAPTATFDAGAGDVILTNPANNFGSVSVLSTGPTVAIIDTNALNVGTIRLGGGTLTLTTGGNLGTATGGSIVQTTGTGAITLNTPAGSNITLGSLDNVLRGMVNVVHAANVTINSQTDLTFTAGSTVTGSLTATAGGILTLPATLNLTGGLVASGFAIPVGTDITAGGISFTGAVTFTGNRTVTSGAGMTFTGDVTAGGPLTLALGTAENLLFTGGTWTQGAHPLTINGTGVDFQLSGSPNNPARLVLAGGNTIAMPGNGNLTVAAGGVLQAGTDSAAPEVVTLANGTGGLIITGALAVGLGAVNDELVKTGFGLVQLGPVAELFGSGLAGTTATPVLANQTPLLIGRFANSVDADDGPRDFFAGSDIVTPAYSLLDVTVKAGGVAAPSGTAAGTLPDGDRYSVKSSLGAAAGLVTVEDVSGRLDVVVRNTTAAAASTLTVSALGGGDGQLPVGGVAVHNPGAVTVTAPAANFVGRLTTAGTLTALTARDLGTAIAPFILTNGGPITGTTAVTARVVQNTAATVVGPLKTFKAVSATLGVSLTARSFGTLTTTGLAAAVNPGDFNATLTSTTTTTGPVVTAGTFAGTLIGTWDVRGSVGKVKAGSTSGWNLGTLAGANIRNGGGLTGVTSLAFGFIDALFLNASGAVGTMTATEIQDSHLTAGSWGTVKVTGSPAHGFVGNFITSTLTATGSVAGVGLKGLTIAGNLRSNSAVNLLNGDATSIVVGQTINGSNITATDTGTHGALKAVTAGSLVSATIDARSVGTLTVKGNLAAGLFGDVTGSTVTARSNALGVGIGTVSASGSVSGSVFDVQSGNLTKFSVGRQLGSTTVRLPDPAFGTLGTIQAGDWTTGVTVLAETIGTVASVGAAAVLPASPLLLGGFLTDTITAYQNSGTVAAIGKLTAKGDFSGSTATAERGIGTVTIGRSLSGGFLIADDAQAGSPAVGRINALTAGAGTNSTVAANTLGTVKVTGYAMPENATTSYAFGDVTAGTITAGGGGAGVPGIATVTVARQFQSGSFLKAPFGIKTLTVGGAVANVSRIVTDNPATPTSGVLTTATIGELSDSTVRAGSIGTLKVTGNVAAGLLGSVFRSSVAAGASGPQSIGTLTVAGDVSDSVVDAPATVGAIAVGGRVTTSSAGTRIQAGYNSGSKLGSLTAGAWGQAGIAQTTDLVTQAVGTFALKGNAARGFVGTTDRGFIDVLGNAGGVGLGTFTATGTATSSLFRVSDGDVGKFTVLRFLSSDLLVGFRPVKGSDLTLAPAAANWAATNHKLGAFTTTAVFDAADPVASASFANSTVVAAILGTVSLSGVNPDAPDTTAFGVAFRTGAGAAAKGVVKKGGVALAPGAVDGRFDYLGLPG